MYPRFACDGNHFASAPSTRVDDSQPRTWSASACAIELIRSWVREEVAARVAPAPWPTSLQPVPGAGKPSFHGSTLKFVIKANLKRTAVRQVRACPAAGAAERNLRAANCGSISPHAQDAPNGVSGLSVAQCRCSRLAHVHGQHAGRRSRPLGILFRGVEWAGPSGRMIHQRVLFLVCGQRVQSCCDTGRPVVMAACTAALTVSNGPCQHPLWPSGGLSERGPVARCNRGSRRGGSRPCFWLSSSRRPNMA